MFERDTLNIWAPQGSVPADIAYSCYAKHETELEDIIETICDSCSSGSIDVSTLDDFSDDDLRYIERKCADRGVRVQISYQS